MIESQNHTVNFHGNPVEVVFEDWGYEPDCGGHVIDWWFVDGSRNGEEHTTEEEMQAVYEELRRVCEQRAVGGRV